MDTRDKRILILKFTPRLSIFLDALADTLKRRGASVRLASELITWRQVPDDFQVSPTLLEEITAYDRAIYNPNHLAGLGRQINHYAARCLYHLEQLIDRYHPTDIVLWNGWMVLTQAAIHLARERSIRVWYMENGAIPDTLQLDSHGVNYASLIAGRDRQFFMDANLDFDPDMKITTPHSCPVTLWQRLETLMRYINHFGMWFLVYIFWKNFIPDQVGKWMRMHLPQDKVVLPERFVFVPLQVQDDTQIIMYSLLVKQMEELVERCYIAIEQADQTLRLVVKEHPQDFGRHSYHTLHKKYPDIIWLRKYPIDKFLKKANVVVAINSGTGVEALIKYKPVITLGQAFYSVPGIVRHANSWEELSSLIENSLTQSVDSNAINKFLGYLQKRHLILGNWNRFSDITLEAASDRILKSEDE